MISPSSPESSRAFLFGLLVLYVGLMVFLGIWGRRRTHNVEDYYIGGRSLSGIALGLSFFATYASTNSYLGFSGKAYSYGPAWLLIIPAAVVFSWLSWRFVTPKLRVATERLGSITIPDYIGFRFGSTKARTAAALIVALASLLYMTAVYKGIGNLLEVLLAVPYSTAIGIVVVTVVLYTTAGGFHSVVRTDGVQAVLMFAAAGLLFTRIRAAAGGAGAFDRLRELANSSTEPFFSGPPLGVLVGVVVASTIKFLVEPRQLSRFYALKSAAEARRGIWVSTICFLVVFSLLAPLGLYGRLLIEGLRDTDLLVPHLLNQPELFGPGARAVMLLALVSAAMSSLDSVLLVVASTCQRDLIEPIFGTREEQRLTATRIWVMVFAIATALLALRPLGGIVELTAFSGALYGACFLPAVILGLYWQRGNGTAVLTSMAVGIVMLLGWKASPWSAHLHQVFPAIAASCFAFVAVAARTPAYSS